MKSQIITAAMALCLIAAPVAEAAGMGNATVDEALMPTKKTTKKSSKKTTSSKKSASSKKSTSSSSSSKAASAASTLATVATAMSGVTQSDNTKKSSASASTGSSLLGGILSTVTGGSSNTGSTSSTGSAAGSILSTVLGGSSSGSTTSNILSGLTSIFNSSKVAKKDQLVGTWTYTEPAVVFSSDNALKNIGGKVASAAVEKQLQSKFEKYGIKKGTMKMTFDSDGNFTQTVGSKTVSGTYTISGQNVSLKYAGTVSQIVGTTQLDGSDLLIVMDASKLLKFANTIGSLTGNSLLSTAGSLISSMDGMQVGLKLNK